VATAAAETKSAPSSDFMNGFLPVSSKAKAADS
jgi:hypothetical protein